MEAFYHSHWILTFLIFFPLVGALAVYLSGEENARTVALGAGIIELLVSVPLFWTYQPGARCDLFPANAPAMQNCVNAPWFPQWGIHYQLGMDGISLFMVLLTGFEQLDYFVK